MLFSPRMEDDEDENNNNNMLLQAAPGAGKNNRRFTQIVSTHYCYGNVDDDTQPEGLYHANDVVKMMKRSSNNGGGVNRIPPLDQADVFALYGSMSKTEQDKELYPSKSARQRIVFSTPITEASVTLERVICVVDCGLRREPRCDVDTGMSRLVTTKISKASAVQRAGRAGRVQEGICLRLYTESDIESGLLDKTPPEIFNTDLAPTLLLLAEWGTSTLEEIMQELPFVDGPSAESLEKAEAFLIEIGALRYSNNDHRFPLTDICEIPCHRRLSMAIVHAKSSGEEALLCAALAASFCLDEDLQRGGSQDLDIRSQLRSFLKDPKNASTLKGLSLIERLLEVDSLSSPEWVRL
ncbi:ATP-dependent helicase [Nitzschia inconspicua]|uniref:ATP-dependent helicase n=1 Tax=Nitzschia inconspicua TaxID=303405 RepID=A0A9K3M6Z4_9STRA|nr:ATP-dependent helicase [Nitzschia inconspicua]